MIGVTNAKYSSSGTGASIDNIGFAIPINHVKGIVESIIENGYIAKPYIGVSVEDVSQETQSYGLPKGAAVKNITEGSPAADAGLKENDIITAVNGEEVSGSRDLVNAVGDASSGDELVLTVYRQGESFEVKIVIGEQVQSALANEESKETQQEKPQNMQGGQPILPWNNRFKR